ncbi:MAG TPA: class I SAM-dependent methyltransferase [bacterium]|nr:class I SAM-dependent methyltransferase [bacterium]
MTEEMGHFLRYSEKRRMQLISRMVPKTGISRLLDVGCGTAELSENLFNRGLNVIALDLGFDSIKRASMKLRNKNLDFPFVQGDIYRLPYEDNSFDAVVASEILEHLEKPQDALGEVARIVRPGGYFIVSTPYCERLRFTLCIHCNKKTPVNAHLHSFDDKIMENMLKEAGFSIEKKIKYGSKHGENLGIPGFTFFLLHVIWRFMDAFLCGLLGKQSFMVIRARRLTIDK